MDKPLTDSEWATFQNLWWVVYGWKPGRSEISWTPKQVRDWISLNK